MTKIFSGRITNLRAGIIFFSCLVGLVVFSEMMPENTENNNYNYNYNISSPTPRSESKNLIFIYGMGGSGTRGVTKLFESWGCSINFYKLNPALDNRLVFRLNKFVDDILNITGGTIDYDAKSLPSSLLLEIEERMKDIVKIVGQTREHSCAVVKWPRLIYLAPVLKLHFPDAKFILVVRDGRDMIFSKNKIQFREFSRFYISPEEEKFTKPFRQMMFWYRLNLQAKTWLTTTVPSDSTMLRIESLVLEADEAVYNQLYSTSLNLPPPRSLSQNEIFETPIANRKYNTTKYGKYKYQKMDATKKMVAEIEEVFQHELEEFGYTIDSANV